MNGNEDVDIPLSGEIVGVKVAYPENMGAECGCKGNVLSIRFTEKEQARIFEITTE